MKIIAHRANIDGPSSDENKLEQIDKCIDLGYDVEIDVRYDPITDRLWLGHDEPQYMVTWYWLANRSEYLWIHCKNIATLHEFSTETKGYNYFWHQSDDYTLTSKNIIWSYPKMTHTSNTVIIMLDPSNSDKEIDCYGICTDYTSKLI